MALREQTVQLTTGIKFGDQQVDEFTLIEPTVEQLEKVEGLTGYQYFRRLIAACSTSPKIDALFVGRMSIADYGVAMAALVEVMKAETSPATE